MRFWRNSARSLRRWKRAAVPVVLVAAVGGGVALREANLLVSRQLPGYLSGRLTQALGRPVSVGRVAFWPIGAFTVRDIRVAAQAGEAAPPLTASDARVYVSWLDLLFHHRLHVTELHLDHARLTGIMDLRKETPGTGAATDKLLALQQMGLRRIGLHHSDADVITIGKSGERTPVTARNVDVEADLHRRDLAYRVRAAQWAGAGVTARDISLEGRAAPDGITLKKSRIHLEGGALAASGTYVEAGGGVSLRVQMNGLPLDRLAPQLGLPAEWDVHGDLTGQMDVSAVSGEVRQIHGTLRMASGSLAHARAVFPWRSATARVDWSPDKAVLRDIDVEGDGIRLRGIADVNGEASVPFTRRPFLSEGTVEATRPEAVASLARLLTFSTPPPGQWDVERATVAFKASGTVGQLRDARASGHFQAQGLLLHPTPEGAPLRVASAEGDLERWPDHLHLRQLRATAEGAVATGAMTVVPTRAGRAGSFTGQGELNFVNLAVFRQQAPALPLWKWVNPATPASQGRVTFAVHGPTQKPEQAAGTGEVALRQFSVTAPAGVAGSAWTVPVRELTAALRVHDNRLEISNAKLRSDQFTGSASGAVAHLNGRGDVTGSVRIASAQWAQLPPVRGHVPAGLSGGTLVLEATIPPHTALRGDGSRASLAELPLEGVASLHGATYQTSVGGKPKTVQVQDAAARFHMADGRLDVPEYRLVTPQFRTSGHGSGRQEMTKAGRGAEWTVRGEGVLSASDAGALARWWSGSPVLQGGKLEARYVVQGPATPDQMAINATVRLTDAQPLLPKGALPFPDASAQIRSLTGGIFHQGPQTRFTDAVWDAPGFRVKGTGSVVGKTVDGTFQITTPDWRALGGSMARALPVAGGTLTADGHLHGLLDRLREGEFRGRLSLRDAHFASAAGAALPLQGGHIDLSTEAHGPLTRLTAVDAAGEFSVRDALLPPLRRGTERLRVEVARGHYQRAGDRVTLTDLVARTPGARLTGKGELRGVGSRQLSHHFSLAAAGPSLAGVLPKIVPLPGTATGGVFTASLEMSGATGHPVTNLDGRVDVRNATWLPPGQKTAFPITHMTGHVARSGDTATLDGVELRMPTGQASLTGSVRGLNTPGGARHALRLKWRLTDASAWASRFLPVPGVFTGGVFTGEARVDGSAREPAATANGSFLVEDAGFLPPERFLGGPLHPIDVSSARGVFTRADHQTTLKDLDLHTSVGTATGSVTSDDRGMARIQARGEVTKLQAFIDLWPGFSRRVRGGRGELTLDLRGPLRHPSALAGTVNVVGTGGELTVDDVDPLYATEPFDELSMRLALGGGSVRLEQVRMRGPKANLDGTGEVTADGQVRGSGNAWFTEQFTRKLIKPKFLGQVARVFGFRRLKSSYKVDGSLRDARLHMGITRSILWKLAVKDRVPPPLRKIATGEAPLWSSDGPPPSRVSLR